MALISCSNCSKQISDRAKVCPHCGQPVVSEVPAEEWQEVLPKLCEECGSELPEGAECCPNCGCPVEEETPAVVEQPQKVELTRISMPKLAGNAKKYLIIAAVALVALVAAIVIGNQVSKANAEKEAARLRQEYGANLESAASTMLVGAIDAEDAGNLIKRVWANAIYEERDSTTDKYTRPNGYFVDDFNTALGNLFKDSDFQDTITAIEINQNLVSSQMKDLKNPPDEYEDAYDALREFYDAYTALTNHVTSPSGSLSTFSENFNNYDSEVVNCYEALQLYID